jgi:hypothetical protein
MRERFNAKIDEGRNAEVGECLIVPSGIYQLCKGGSGTRNIEYRITNLEYRSVGTGKT